MINEPHHPNKPNNNNIYNTAHQDSYYNSGELGKNEHWAVAGATEDDDAIELRTFEALLETSPHDEVGNFVDLYFRRPVSTHSGELSPASSSYYGHHSSSHSTGFSQHRQE
jgi:hypothetical protein